MPYAVKKSRDGYFVVNATTGAKYSKKPQTKAKAESQLRILNEALYGEGIFDSLKNAGKRIANVFTNSYSPNTDAAVKKYGAYTVAGFEILRKPVESVFKSLLNVISAGKFSDYKYKYDDVFHLSLILKLTSASDTVYLMTEKRPNIQFEVVKGFEDHKLPLEDVMLDTDFTHISFAELIMRTMAIMGSKFHTYDPVNNNCQVYVVALVNQLGVFKHNAFILQNARDFVSGHTSGIATFITSAGHAFGRLTGNAKASGRIGLAFKGGNELPEFAPFVNSEGIKEIPIENFAHWQQYLAELPPDQVVQDLTTLGVAGKVGDAALSLAEAIPEIGPAIGLLHQAANALIGVFYTPKATIANRLKDAGIDIFCDDCQITNPQYPDTDPKHYVILLPDGQYANAAEQARYSALIFYQKVLGFNPATWISRISAAEKTYLFPPGDVTWASKFGALADVHGHANPFLVTAKFPK